MVVSRVAVMALEAAVAIDERKAGFGGVIETQILPCRDAVTGTAIAAVTSAVYVVDGVTTGAARRGIQKLIAAVAVRAGNPCMAARECVSDARVIELFAEQLDPSIMPVEGDANTSADYIFEPSKPEIVEQLIPKSLKTQLYKAIRDSFASEHGARMTAMHKATDNAGELKDQLTLTYNKARQAAITGEILEIVGGAEALND